MTRDDSRQKLIILLQHNKIYDKGTEETFMKTICIVKKPSSESVLKDFDFTLGDNE